MLESQVKKFGLNEFNEISVCLTVGRRETSLI